MPRSHPLSTWLIAATFTLPLPCLANSRSPGVHTDSGRVSVTPDYGATVHARTHSNRNAVVFRVTNTGSTQASFEVRCAVSGQVESCAIINDKTVIVEARKFVTVPVRYTAADAGTGRVMLTAAAIGGSPDVEDSGGFDVSIMAVPCLEDCGGGGSQPDVTVEIYPYSGTFTTSPVDVVIFWCSVSSPLNASSRSITRSGTNITSSFTYGSGFADCVGNYRAKSQGTVTLPLFKNKVIASISNNYSQTGADTVSYTYAPLSPGPPTVDISMNPGTRLVRSACVTAGSGPAGAFQCGDLLAAHSTAGYRTLDRDRQLTLLYNSATARPYSVVMADATLPPNTQIPDRIDAALIVNGATRATASFNTVGYGGATRRLALGFDPVAANLATGVHRYTLQVSHVYGTQSYTTNATGDLIVVDRRLSPYGAGWSVAGVERLFGGSRDEALLLVDGDGSALVYELINPGVWVWLAPTGAYRDTLRYGTVSDGSVPHGDYHWRRGLDGTRTFYSPNGHVRFVVDRIGNKAEYAYLNLNDPNSAIDYIQIAPWDLGKRYQFAYNNGKLSSITDPASRVLTVSINASNQLMSLHDAGAVNPIRYAYDASQRLTQWQSRLGAVTAYRYYTNPLFGATGMLLSDSLPITTVANANTYRPVQLVALATASSGNPTAWPDTAYVMIDGPRTDVTDVTRFLVNRDNAPTRIINALGQTTTIEYDPATPLLANRIVYPNGRIVRMRYDSKARLEWVEDNTPDAQRDSIKYVYGNPGVPDLATQVTVPLDATRRLSSSFVYNANGTLQQVTDPRGQITTFLYNARGQDTTVRQMSVPVYPGQVRTVITKFRYDALANQDTVISDEGRRSKIRRDSLGNIVMSGNSVGDSVTYTYDVRNRQRSVRQYDAQGTYTTNLDYDDDGRFITRTDPRLVIRRWEYDRIGRDTATVDEFNKREIRRYDPAGNVVATISRTTHQTSMIYDALNRLQTRVLNQVVVGGVVVPADTSTFTYGIAGTALPTLAVNRNSLIRRTYSLDGALLTEFDSLKWTSQTASKTYAYNRSGARTSFVTPHARTLSYSFDNTGTFSALGTPSGTAQLRFHALGARDSLWLPDGSATKYQYDGDGLLRRIYTYHPNISPQNQNKGIVDTYLHYDAAGRPDSLIDRSVWANAFNGDKTIFLYDRRGQISSVTNLGLGTASTYTYDASGNRATEITNSQTFTYVYPANTNRLQARTDNLGSYFYRYDDNGAVVADSTYRPYGAIGPTGSFRRILKSYYDAAGRLAATKLDSLVYNSSGQLVYPFNPVLLEYRHDPFGRQLVRQNATGGPSPAWYDGHNILAIGNREIVSAGLDEPLMILSPSGQGVCAANPMYFVTSGNRMFGYHRPNGTSCIDPGNVGWEEYGKNAGAIYNSFTFGLTSASGFTGLSFFRNRVYDGRAGRFTQEDPIGFGGGSNLYAYAGNNPASFTDRFGLCPETGDNLPCIDGYDPIVGTAKRRDSRLDFGQLVDMAYAGPVRTSRQEIQRPASDVAPPPLMQCASAYYDVGDLALRGVLTAPIPKSALGLKRVADASRFTNVISAVGLRLAPGLKIGTQVLGTNRVFGLAGRLSYAAGAGMLAYDFTTIALCASTVGL